MDSGSSFSRDDLLTAWLAAEGSRGAHPDVADYYYRRAWAMCSAFVRFGPRLDFTECAKEHRTLYTVFQRTVDLLNASRSPWGVFLVGAPPPEFAQVKADHAGAIDAASEQLQAAYRELLFDLMERIWKIGPGAAIRRDALREYGFDPDAPEPDLDAHW